MRNKSIFFLVAVLCFFSKQAFCAAAASGAPEFHKTEEYKRWTKLKQGVARHDAPFNLPSFFTTQIETRLLVEAVKKKLGLLMPETLIGSNSKIGNEILSFVTGYKAREPKDSKIIKDKYGRIKDVYAPEMFSVSSKMDIFPVRFIINEKGEKITITNVCREDIYETVVEIVTSLANALRGV